MHRFTERARARSWELPTFVTPEWHAGKAITHQKARRFATWTKTSLPQIRVRRPAAPWPPICSARRSAWRGSCLSLRRIWAPISSRRGAGICRWALPSGYVGYFGRSELNTCHQELFPASASLLWCETRTPSIRRLSPRGL